MAHSMLTTSTDICSLPGITGPCYGLIGRYYHINGECVYFTWSGCGGNANNFETLSQCQNTCLGINASGNLYDAESEPIPSHTEDPHFRSYHLIIVFVAIYIVICILGVSYFVTYQRKTRSDSTQLTDGDDLDNPEDKSSSDSRSSTQDSQRTDCIQTKSVSISYPKSPNYPRPPPRISSMKHHKSLRTGTGSTGTGSIGTGSTRTLGTGLSTKRSTNPFDNLSPTFQSVELPKSLGRRTSAGIAARKSSQNTMNRSPSSTQRSTFEKQPFLQMVAKSISPRGRRNRYQLQLDVGEEELEDLDHLDGLDGAEHTVDLVSRVEMTIDGGVEMTIDSDEEEMETNLEAIIAKKEEFFKTNPITPKMGRSITNHDEMTETIRGSETPKTPIRSTVMTPSFVQRAHSPRLTITIEGDIEDTAGAVSRDGVDPQDGGTDGDNTTMRSEERRRSTTVTTMTTLGLSELSMAAVDSEFFSGDHDPDHDPMEHIVPGSKSSSEHLIEEEVPTGSQIDALQGLMAKLDDDENMLHDMDWQMRSNRPRQEYTTVAIEEI